MRKLLVSLLLLLALGAPAYANVENLPTMRAAVSAEARTGKGGFLPIDEFYIVRLIHVERKPRENKYLKVKPGEIWRWEYEAIDRGQLIRVLSNRKIEEAGIESKLPLSESNPNVYLGWKTAQIAGTAAIGVITGGVFARR